MVSKYLIKNQTVIADFYTFDDMYSEFRYLRAKS